MIGVGLNGEYTALPQEKVIYGPGCLGRLGPEMDRLERRRALVITGSTLARRTPVIQTVERILGSRHVATYSEVRQHAPESGIVAAADLARRIQADTLISVGGGSPIDAAKAVARSMAGAIALEEGAYPLHIAVPTTLSAAEFSHVAGYTDEQTHSKTGFADEQATPRLVLLDPEITLHTPLWLWLSSGMRSLDHGVETLYSPGYHPLNDVLALEAIERLFEFLTRCKADPEDLEARHQCQLAAWMSYFAPASAGAHLGLSHTIGKKIGARYDVPHGVTSCILLAPVMVFKAQTEADRLAPMGRRLGLATGDTQAITAALAAAEAVADLVRRLELPARLRDVEVPWEELDAIAATAASAETGKEEILRILHQAW